MIKTNAVFDVIDCQVRMITSKGKQPTKALIVLIWELLTVDNVMQDERGVQQLIDGSDTTGLHTLLINPNTHLCELLKRVLKCTPPKQGTAYRNAYIGKTPVCSCSFQPTCALKYAIVLAIRVKTKQKKSQKIKKIRKMKKYFLHRFVY
jgi:hypothetical protein